MSQKKMVSRNVAIALGIICIILVAGLGVVLFMGYSPTSGSSGTYWETKFNDLNATHNNYMNTHSHSDSDYNQLQTWLDGNITAYNNYVSDHHYTDEEYNSSQSIIYLQDSTVWVDAQTNSQPAGGLGFANTNWTESVSYAGYVTVYIASATETIYVDLMYSSYGLQYSQEVNVGTTGTAIFPVLPATILIEVGNRNLVLGSTETVTITYHY